MTPQTDSHGSVPPLTGVDAPPNDHEKKHATPEVDGATTGSGGTVDPTALADRLSALLSVRGNAARTGHALRLADETFDALHEHLRHGGTPPRGWSPARGAKDRRYTNTWFDALSETLRDPHARPTPRATADAAEVAWNALDAALREGAPMPEPWEVRRRR